MVRVLVSYYSRGGNTKAIAQEIARGAREVQGVKVKVKAAKRTKLRDLKEADAIVFGSPTYYGVMAAELKRLVDRSVAIHGSLEGKVGAAFTSSGGISSGAETTLMSIIQAMLVHGMIVQGYAHSQHYGVGIQDKPKGKHIRLCRERGRQVAELAAKLAGKK